MPLVAPGFDQATEDLAVSLAQLLFPILVMLGVSGVVVGVLNSYNRFGVFAIAPLFWNVAIIAVLVGLAPAFPEGDEIYAYAIGVLVGTVLQLAMVAYDLRNTPFRLQRVFDWRSPLVKKVLLLMLPVTISLGLINFNLSINSLFATLVEGTISPRRPSRSATTRRRRSTRRSGSTCFPRVSSRSRSRRSSSRPSPASPPAASTTTCARRWPTACG